MQVDYERIAEERPARGLRYVGVGVWLVVLVIGWLESRALCVWCGFPSDCHDADLWSVYTDMVRLCEKGVCLSWLCDLPSIQPTIGTRKSAALFGLFLAVGPAFARIGQIPALQSSLSSFGARWDAPTIVYLVVFVMLLVLLVYQHVAVGRAHGKRTLAAYAATRLGLLLFYAGFGVALSQQYHIHEHHLYVGFVVASAAYGEDTVSLLLLTCGSAVMVQGIGAYNYATIIEE